MVKTNSKPVGEEELNEESKIEEIIEKEEKSHRAKDGTGYGDLNALNVISNDINTDDDEVYVGKPARKGLNNETYIDVKQKTIRMNHTDMNKIQHTKVGDYINYYQNGVRDSGVVAKMSNGFVTIFKEDGSFYDVHINDTFFVSDILVNKTWNEMSLEERTDELFKVKAYSPRFISKKWEDLPKELQSVLKIRGGATPKNPDKYTENERRNERYENLERDIVNEPANQIQSQIARRLSGNAYNTTGSVKGVEMSEHENDRLPSGKSPKIKPKNASDIEHQTHGSVAGSPLAGVSTDISFDASDDYEGASHEKRDEQFKHEHKKPKVDKKKMGDFTYSEKPNYKTKGIPEQSGNTWGMKYGVKLINKDEEEK